MTKFFFFFFFFYFGDLARSSPLLVGWATFHCGRRDGEDADDQKEGRGMLRG